MTVVNPYAHLIKQARALLSTESTLGPDLREPFSWIIRAEFLDSSITVIKGGANTCVVQLGETRMPPCFPQDAVQFLDELRRQPHWMYVVVRADGRKKRFHALRQARLVRPGTGDRIYGVGPGEREVTHVGRADAVTQLVKWLAKKRM